MEEKITNAISAKEARQLADTSPAVLIDIYNLIKNSAEEGMTSISRPCYKMSRILLHSIFEELVNQGYDCRLIPDVEDSYILTIDW